MLDDVPYPDAGLITIKTAVISVVATNFGLSKSEAIRTGFMLSQVGGVSCYYCKGVFQRSPIQWCTSGCSCCRCIMCKLVPVICLPICCCFGVLAFQGGEFAFVLLSLAASLKVLPENLNQVGARHMQRSTRH
jgi:hypothetical protein